MFKIPLVFVNYSLFMIPIANLEFKPKVCKVNLIFPFNYFSGIFKVVICHCFMSLFIVLNLEPYFEIFDPKR